MLIFAALASACAVNRGNVFPLPRGYLLESEVFAAAKAIQDIDPGLVRLNIIGFSGTENLPLYALEIGRAEASRNVLIIGQHHGNEVLGVDLVMAWANELARKSASDKRIDAILDEFRFWIVPTINPEGYRVVSRGLFQNKRKNNRDTDGNGRLDVHTDGVDLNRNYPVFWDEDRVLPPSHHNYKGSAPASEPEVKAVIALAQKTRFELAIFYHSSPTGALAEKIFLPSLNPGNARQKARYDSLQAISQSYADDIKKDYLKGNYELGTMPGTRIGTARNYFFHIQETAAFLVEIGGVNKDGISVIHPPAKKKDQIMARHVKALRKLFYSGLRS
ncbi:MAG: succinylglutamate desuccinylase/aspartoacylase family protein [Candidatus Syntrophosphaera sp.]|nr:succinylglutamate desuccinylase/aspartoacylase family protein [Candidatus Syntrophosphaera sp.]